MRKRILLTLAGCAAAFTGMAQSSFSASTLQLKANDLVYDSVTQRIYATVPSANGSNGNSIGVINPVTATLDSTIFVGSEPSVMAISEDGQYIYAGFTGSSTVRRFNIATLQVDKTIPLGNTGSGSGSTPLFANDIEVMPGSPLVIAVSLKNKVYSPSHEGVAIYDDGVKRTTVTPGHTGSNQIEFSEQQPNRLFGYNNESTEFGLRYHTVLGSGVTTNGVYPNLFSDFYIDFIYASGKLYSTNGTAVDVSGTPYVDGQFGNAASPVAYDYGLNRVCYASSSSFWGNGYFIFRRYNPNTYLQTDSFAFPQLVEKPLKLITCGPDCYAFNTESGKVIILKPQQLSVGGSSFSENKVLWSPNPVTEGFIRLIEPQKVKSILVLSMEGRTVLISSAGQPEINLTALPAGLYNIVVEEIDGQRTMQKLLKK